jgi:hypothetical protein
MTKTEKSSLIHISMFHQLEGLILNYIHEGDYDKVSLYHLDI